LPTASRLVSGFWMRGRFGDVAEVASELTRTGALAKAPVLIRVRDALAAAIAGHQPAAITAAGVDDARKPPRLMAQTLAGAAQHLGAATPASLEPAVKLLAGPGGSEARAALADLTGALNALLADDRAALGGGSSLALGWLADRREEPALARPFYALAAFQSEGVGVLSRLAELGRALRRPRPVWRWPAVAITPVSGRPRRRCAAPWPRWRMDWPASDRWRRGRRPAASSRSRATVARSGTRWQGRWPHRRWSCPRGLTRRGAGRRVGGGDPSRR